MSKRQILVQDLAQNLECPVCFEIPNRPIFTCEVGHLVCERCHRMLRSCPLCRSSFRGTRSFIAESLVSTINKLVCGSPITPTPVSNGRTCSTPGNFIRCCLAVNRCRNRLIDASTYIEHLKTTHGVFVAHSANGKFVHKVHVSPTVKTLVKRGVERLFILEVAGRSFVVNMYQDGNEIRIWAQTEQTTDGSLSKVDFSICTAQNEKISWSGGMNTHQVTEMSVRLTETCMIVSSWKLKECVQRDEDDTGSRFWKLNIHIYSSTKEILRAHPISRKVQEGYMTFKNKVSRIRDCMKGVRKLLEDMDSIQGTRLHRLISDALIVLGFVVLLIITFVFI